MIIGPSVHYFLYLTVKETKLIKNVGVGRAVMLTKSVVNPVICQLEGEETEYSDVFMGG